MNTKKSGSSTLPFFATQQQAQKKAAFKKDSLAKTITV